MEQRWAGVEAQGKPCTSAHRAGRDGHRWRKWNKENKGSRSGRPVEEASPLNVELPLRLHYLGALINLRLEQTESIVADSETQRVSGRYNCSLCRCQAPGGM